VGARSSFELPARYQRHLGVAEGRACRWNVRAWFAELADEEIYLSVLTIGEIRRGVESVRRRDPDSAAALDSWLTRLGEAHRDRILPVDRAIAEEWGRMNVPDPLPVIDGLLAATAKLAGLTFATRNVADVEGSGVELVNPFS
jgi:predicted nucleic acid-binding protein